jgi:HK97 family phage portal protein
MTAFAFREAQMGQILMAGTCFAEIERDRLDNIIGLWPLLTDRMETLRSKGNGELFYKYEIPGQEPKIFRKEAILRINGYSHSGLLGYRTIDKSREAIALNLAYEEYAARYFGDGARPPLALEHPEQIGKDALDNLRASFQKSHEGLSASQRIAILEEGMKLHEYGFSVADSQVPELRYFQIDEVCRVFNVPPHMLHNLNRATFNNIEELSRGFVKFSLRYWLVRFEQAYNTQLLKPKEQNKYFFEHVFEGLLRGDIKTRYEAYQVAVSNGWMNADEIRELENMNPQPGEQGGKYFVPLNWIPKEDAGQVLEPVKEPLEEKPTEEGDKETKEYWLDPDAFRKKEYEFTRDNDGLVNNISKIKKKSFKVVRDSDGLITSVEEGEDNQETVNNNKEKRAQSVVERDRIIKQYYPLFKQAAQRIVNKEAIAIKKKVKQSKRANPQLQKWLEDFYRKQSGYIKEQIGPVFSSFAEAIGDASKAEMGVEVEGLEKFIADFIDRYSERHIESSEGQLIALLEGELEELENRVEEWREKRPDKIALNETNRMSNAVYGYIAFGAGMALIWRIRGARTCPYCKELDGRRISSGQTFVSDGDELNPKGGTGPMKIRGMKKHPPLHQACDCYASVS